MNLPNNRLIQEVASYWGIYTLGVFKNIIFHMNSNAKITYFAANSNNSNTPRVEKSTRVRNLQQELLKCTSNPLS